MHKRINSAKSTIPTKKWSEDESKRLKYLYMI